VTDVEQWVVLLLLLLLLAISRAGVTIFYLKPAVRKRFFIAL
jgi:hypothetical protein